MCWLFSVVREGQGQRVFYPVRHHDGLGDIDSGSRPAQDSAPRCHGVETTLHFRWTELWGKRDQRGSVRKAR